MEEINLEWVNNIEIKCQINQINYYLIDLLNNSGYSFAAFILLVIYF